ncbi:hypothetical protein ACIQU6_43420 [Streptomyces sp. NPDC090442]|uniref:hypothetical protein n=1 Tax=Streptomyces sp. NPDC090442 TaxID=3365962 RepID=UPI00382E01FB
MARQDVKDEVIHLRSAGVDLSKRFLLACARTPSPQRPGSWSLETERFGTTQAEIRRLLIWLVEAHVEVVVMEATSDYWRSVYYMLQYYSLRSWGCDRLWSGGCQGRRWAGSGSPRRL